MDIQEVIKRYEDGGNMFRRPSVALLIAALREAQAELTRKKDECVATTAIINVHKGMVDVGIATAEEWKARAEQAEAEAAKYRKSYESTDEVFQAFTAEMLKAGMSAVEGNEFHWHNKRAEKAEQEAAKYKAALNKIANHKTGAVDGDFCTTSYDCWACEEMIGWAQAALKDAQ